MQKRNVKIDLLRSIAMMGIFIAHANPNEFLFRFRNFDVVLIVLLLGASFFLSIKNKNINYFGYIIKRFNRLVIPTWIFLTIFFVFFYILSLTTGIKFFELKSIVTSYSLISGIGYVWIMKVFFIVAIVSPLLLNVSNNIKSDILFFFIIILLYAGYHIMYLYNKNMNGILAELFNLFILQGIGYSIIAIIGIRLLSLSSKEIMCLCLSNLIIFVICIHIYNFDSTQNYKYPPTIYYISYGIFMSTLLYALLDIRKIYRIFNNNLLLYISRNSLWLYFWHLIPIYLLKYYPEELSLISNLFIFRLMFIIIVAILLDFIAKKIIYGYKELSK